MMKQLLSLFLCAVLLLSLGGCTLPEEDRFVNHTEVVIWGPTEPPTTVPTVPPTETTAPPLQLTPAMLVDSLTLDQLISQLFLVKCPYDGAEALLDKHHIGGLVLFSQDFAGQTPASLRATLEDYQSRVPVPLIISVDEEGGVVNRVSSNEAFRSKSFPSPRTVYLEGGTKGLRDMEEEKSQFLHSLGINVNLAPVCDLVTEENAFMADRALFLPLKSTGESIAVMVKTMQQNQVGAVLKHFPGYGNLRGDTHTGKVVDDRSLEMLRAYDLVPFQYGIDAGVGSVMISHNIVNCLDPASPASLSPAVHDLLRLELGFEGVIMTDDLAMGAITELYEPGEAAVQAILAGNDLLITAWTEDQFEAVRAAVDNGRIPFERIRDSAIRIIRWKMDLGLL